MKIETYTGGIAATNAYYLPEARVLFDAPEGALEWVRNNGWTVDQLLLTHGHFDHIWDAAAVKKATGCRVGCHEADRPLLADPGGQARLFGLDLDDAAIAADFPLEDGGSVEAEPFTFRLMHIPGHCPGSVCFHCEAEGLVFAGDVLFAGSVGRTDLPGGSRERLLDGIRRKLLVLPDPVWVYPGHGPPTRIGRERETNPYLQDDGG